ncbi:hypothetical protein [Flavobacterium aquatile]|uniref:Uncharacterized protein n=1 Tax=Flavobacterium aquatile LMG 4008 = ATCC 11947 TaxID=1453498 RepID=A0A095V201_9FLAO|nr:hypothetical protein [Flavobacterium aquatile]KGD68885.1 hypothetical protein LG45_04365 [Flavobacterium aquatile LMG 4008 = ATCC 11947]OXA69402.1 hypothetical protein B0A61_00930 [Flavobacterium aquatile LMG 4008 = ATCC 11947]GEC79375.1 hypothetical protein FAQ01_22450 [Flavobacterium aquatile]
MLKITKFFTIIILVLLSVDSYSQVNGVGINTIDPKSTLDINGNLSIKVATIPGGPSGAAAQITDQGVYLSLDANGSNNDFQLPNPVTVPGRIYILRNISTTNTAYLLTTGTTGSTGKFFAKDSSNPTETSGTAVINMPANGNSKSIIIVSDGANWTYF